MGNARARKALGDTVRDREVGATAGLPCDGTHGEARDGERKGKPPASLGWRQLG